MAFKLSKEERLSQSRHIVNLTAATEALIADQDLDNIAAYNEAVSGCNGFIEGVAERLREEWDERSEKWQESEVGEDACAMTEAWEDFSLNEYVVDEDAGPFSDDDATVLNEAIEEFSSLQDTID